MLSRLALLLMIACSLVVLEGCATATATKQVSKRKKAKRAKTKKPTTAIAQAPGAELLEDDEELDDGGFDDEEDGEDLTSMVIAEGRASFYHDSLAGRPTANGEKYSPEAKTCAHKTLPFGTIVVVEDVETRKWTRCRVNDRGPFVAGRIIDLSKRVARELGILDKGVTKVRVRVVRQAAS